MSSGIAKARRSLVFIGAAACMLVVLAGAVQFVPYTAHRVVGPPPADLHARTVTIPTSPSGRVAGWWMRGKPKSGVVLVLHGVSGDRNEMVDRARFLGKLGYGVLLIDLPSHGESSGDRITYGIREAEGVRAALSYLAQNAPGERIGVIGVSLGAAALVLSRPNPAPSAVVLESMFPSIEEAITDRLKFYLGALGASLAPLVVRELPVTLGISPADLRPIDETSALHCPVFVIAGSADRFTTLPETLRIFAAAPEPKELWVVDGAAHVDLHDVAPAYEARVGAFLAKYLRPSAGERG